MVNAEKKICEALGYKLTLSMNTVEVIQKTSVLAVASDISQTGCKNFLKKEKKRKRKRSAVWTDWYVEKI